MTTSDSKVLFTLTTPLGSVFQGEVDEITLTTQEGEITILPHHIPLVSLLEVGHIRVKDGEEEHYFAIDGGIVDVRHDGSVVVLSQRSESAREIDIERAERAMERAKEYMSGEGKKEAKEYRRLQYILKKEENRIRVAKKGHRK